MQHIEHPKQTGASYWRELENADSLRNAIMWDYHNSIFGGKIHYRKMDVFYLEEITTDVTYDGELVCALPHGCGTVEMGDESKYCGRFRYGNPTGLGIWTKPTGVKFEINWDTSLFREVFNN